MALHSRIFGVKRELACQERVSFGQVHTVRWAVYKVTCLSSCLILMFNLKFNLNSAKADIRIWKSDKLPKDIRFPLRPRDMTCHGHSAKSWAVGQNIILFISVLRSWGLRCNVKEHTINP